MRYLIFFSSVLLLAGLIISYTGCNSSEVTDCAVGGTPWNHAVFHVGENTAVYGPVLSTSWNIGSEGNVTILSIGTERPKSRPDAFVVKILNQNRNKFPYPPEDYYLGKTICVKGKIIESEGLTQIEVSDPSQIQEY
jgi:hypothetical protein